MPRTLRTFAAGVAYHVISRWSGRAPIFRDEEDYNWYLRYLVEAKRKYEVEVFHYVLMPNHVHLLVRPSETNGSGFMQWLNSAYATYFCKKRKRIGHVWKNRFLNKPVETDAYLLSCGNYIEMNPVRAKIVAEPAAWPYSSHRYYVGAGEDPIVDPSPLYENFGRTTKERIAAYRKWMGKTRQS